MNDSTADERAIREQETRIRQFHADAMLKLMDAIKRDQDIRFGPAQLAMTSIAATAALFGAAFALLKWLG